MLRRMVVLGRIVACLTTCAVVACTDLKSADVDAGEDDGGAVPIPPAADSGGASDGGVPEDAEPAGRTCPLASDSPEALAYLTKSDTVFDSVTGLMWERPYRDVGLASYGAAEDTCTALRIDGHADWRIPTRSELMSILDFSKTVPKISRTTFTDAKPDVMWTSTFYAGGPKDAWLVDFFTGSSIHFADLTDGTDGGAPSVLPRVRCVRTVDPPCAAEPRFVRDGSVVRDLVTGLEWMADAGSPRGSTEATAYCRDTAGIAGRPWRLPSVKESDALITGTAADGYIAGVFLPSAWIRFWTGTRSASGGLDSSFELDLTKGTVNELLFTAEPRAVRCVR